MFRLLVVIWALLLLVVAQAVPVDAKDIARLQAGVVKITAKTDGSPKVGTGFIVRIDKDTVYIITAAHVVAGDRQPQVEFFPKRNVSVPAEVLPGAEGGDEVRGLAMLMVKGKDNIPSGIAALPLASNVRLSGGEDLILIGFPRGGGPWAIIKGNVSSRQGRDIYFSPTVGEGNSGGPIIQNGKVVGLVGAGSQSIGQGVTVRSIEDYIEGFGVTAQESAPSGIAEERTQPPSVAKSFPTPTFPTQPSRAETTPDHEITGKDGAPMVLIPAGEFMMGSQDNEGEKDERPRHRVYLDAFYMDKFEVTVSLYGAFMRSTGQPTPENWNLVKTSKHNDLPVVGVDWSGADAYCHWAGKRLPTEAEWEKAARGTDGRTYPWGDESPTTRLAIYGKPFSMNAYEEKLARVDSYEAGKSPYGLYHMAGNVWEWVGDWYDQNYYGKSPERNPKGPSSGEYRVLRGGSWFVEPVFVRSATRYWTTPTTRRVYFGFRCARDAQ